MRCRVCQQEKVDGGRPLAGAVLESVNDVPAGVQVLRTGRNKLGRDPGCEVVVSDVRASGEHAILFVTADGATLSDVSRNGTLVDGQVLQGGTARVHHGTVLQIGAVRLVVLLAPERA